MLDINIFLRAGIVDPEIAKKISAEVKSNFGGDLFSAMVSNGISEEKILSILSSEYGVPYKIKEPGEISNNLLSFITESSAREYGIVPLELVDGVLDIGSVDPNIAGMRDAIRFIGENKNVAYRIYLISPRLYKSIVDRYSGVGNVSDDVLKQVSGNNTKDEDGEIITIQNDDTKPVDVTATKEDAPMRRVLSTIIRDAISMKASDIHMENTGKVVRVRYRIDGVLETKTTIPSEAAASLVALVKLNSKLLLDEHRKPQDGSFSVVYQNRNIDLRVSTLPAYYGEKVVIRILDTAAGIFKLSEIKMTPSHLKIMQDALARPYGLILITGPTGSGKSTTLYAMLSELDRESHNIVSLEDPVEYHVDGITQSQVHSAIGYTFASGLRSILRQDPDIIMVGEIRDKETAELAIQAALTGHLVLATLHTNNAVGAVPRLIDMGIDPYLIAPTLILSVAQRLTRTFANESTKKAVPANEAIVEMYEKSVADLPSSVKEGLPKPEFVYEPVSTSEYPTGLAGRMPVFEMFPVDQEMQHLFLSAPKEDEIYKLARAKGMLTMREDAAVKAFAGKIPFKEVYSL
jgi:type IV pilus assembly protein PilB